MGLEFRPTRQDLQINSSLYFEHHSAQLDPLGILRSGPEITTRDGLGWREIGLSQQSGRNFPDDGRISSGVRDSGDLNQTAHRQIDLGINRVNIDPCRAILNKAKLGETLEKCNDPFDFDRNILGRRGTGQSHDARHGFNGIGASERLPFGGLGANNITPHQHKSDSRKR